MFAFHDYSSSLIVASLLGRGNCGTIGTLDPAKVTGTVVLCTEDDYFTQNLTGPAQAGAVGVILPADHNSFSTDFGVDIVVCQVSTEDGNVVLTYIETSGYDLLLLLQVIRNWLPPLTSATFTEASKQALLCFPPGNRRSHWTHSPSSTFLQLLLSLLSPLTGPIGCRTKS